MAKGKRQFVNTSDGYIGVTVYTPRGEEKGVAVEPGATVFLSDEEIELTRDAPAHANDNPFAPQPFERKDPDTDQVIEKGERPFLEELEQVRETPSGRRIGRQSQQEVGAVNLQPGKPATGSFAQGEEV